MTTYESDVKKINTSSEDIYNTLSDLKRLKELDTSSLAEAETLNSYLKNAEFTEDACYVEVESLGRIGLKIIEREPTKTIKFQVENLPVAANAWIQLKEIAPNDTRIKLTMKAEIPAMIKMMVDKKIKKAINATAEGIANAFNGKLS